MLNLVSGLMPVAEKLITRILPDKEGQRKALLELQKLEASGEIKDGVEFADKDSARKNADDGNGKSTRIMASEKYCPGISLGTTLMTFALFLILMLIDIPDKSHDLSMILLGGLLSSQSVILSFYFGSSMGSKEKSEDLVNVFKKRTEGN